MDQKKKVVFVLGATGTGKSKLAIALATQFGGEIVNSDKMQVYTSLDVITNKATAEELAAVPHHLIGFLPPDADFTPSDFRRSATLAIDSILRRNRLPIVAGGSHRYIKALVDADFTNKYDSCFVWMDVEQEALDQVVAERVDEMVERGLVEEARGVFDPKADYGKGVRRAIGVPEMDMYLRGGVSKEKEMRLLNEAIEEVKRNTCMLTRSQMKKIQWLRKVVGWDLKRIDSTQVFRRWPEGGGEIWEEVVGAHGREIVQEFLECREEEDGRAVNTKDLKAAVPLRVTTSMMV